MSQLHQVKRLAKVAHSDVLADPAHDVDLGGVPRMTTPLHMRVRYSRFCCLAWRRTLVPVLALAVSFVSPNAAAGQDAPDSWNSKLEFGFTGASGNTSFSILTGAFSVTRLERESYELDISGRIRRGRSDGKTIANDLRGTVKFDWNPQATFSPFIFATGSRDVIRNVDARLLVGGGGKWTFLQRSDLTKMSVSVAAVLDHENYRLEPGSTEDEVITFGRLSWRTKFDHEFASGATFRHITFWQPRITNFSDYIVDVSNSLSSQLLSNLSLVITHSYIHEAEPPPGAVRDDQRVGVVLSIAL